MATTPALRRSQRGSEYVRLSRSPASGSIHLGSIFAAVRPKSREVSTSSAAMIQSGPLRAITDPGKTVKREPRAPW